MTTAYRSAMSDRITPKTYSARRSEPTVLPIVVFWAAYAILTACVIAANLSLLLGGPAALTIAALTGMLVSAAVVAYLGLLHPRVRTHRPGIFR